MQTLQDFFVCLKILFKNDDLLELFTFHENYSLIKTELSKVVFVIQAEFMLNISLMNLIAIIFHRLF